jgi:hypothetical protein
VVLAAADFNHPQFRWHTATMDARLRVHEGGSGEPLLVLLH